MEIICFNLSIILLVISLMIMDNRYERKIKELENAIENIESENRALIEEILSYF